MKKAIAIINVPDDTDINELCITFDLEKMLDQDGNTETIFEGISEPLEPLPEKKLLYKPAKGIGKAEALKALSDNLTAIGWNDCLRAIQGETE